MASGAFVSLIGSMTNLADLYKQLDAWYDSRAGRESSTWIREHLTGLQQNLWGRDAVYCGPATLFDEEVMRAGAVHHRFVMHPSVAAGDVRGCPDALPFAADSLSLLALAHPLDLSEQPHQVLREAERVLGGNGYLLLIGFNPWSWYGLYRLFSVGRFPWNRHFYGFRRIRDWLAVLNFEIKDCRYAAFRPPVQSRFVQRHLEKLEIQARWRIDHFGGVYCILARKLRVPVIPMRERWYQKKSALIPDSLASEPTSRSMLDEAS